MKREVEGSDLGGVFRQQTKKGVDFGDEKTVLFSCEKCYF